MYEFAPATLRVAPRHEGSTTAPFAADGQTPSMLLDVGEGMHVLASEVIAVQVLPAAADYRRRFRKMGDPRATVMLRGGQVLDAFREADELRADWERSLRADWGMGPRAFVSAAQVA
jgi:hypothetical protein